MRRDRTRLGHLNVEQLEPRHLLSSGPRITEFMARNDSTLDDEDFLIVAELIVAGEKTLQPRFYPEPTPGADNGVGVAGFVKDTRFSVDRGFYDTPFQVEITSETPAAVIRYTTDGSPPSESHGTIYTEPILVNTTTNLRAIAFKEDYLLTNVDTHTTAKTSNSRCRWKSSIPTSQARTIKPMRESNRIPTIG
jgi:hypothetical protein